MLSGVMELDFNCNGTFTSSLNREDGGESFIRSSVSRLNDFNLKQKEFDQLRHLNVAQFAGVHDVSIKSQNHLKASFYDLGLEREEKCNSSTSIFYGDFHAFTRYLARNCPKTTKFRFIPIQFQS
jgi:hypothetical protein